MKTALHTTWVERALKAIDMLKMQNLAPKVGIRSSQENATEEAHVDNRTKTEA